jgi:hypothetical protein
MTREVAPAEAPPRPKSHYMRTRWDSDGVGYSRKDGPHRVLIAIDYKSYKDALYKTAIKHNADACTIARMDRDKQVKRDAPSAGVSEMCSRARTDSIAILRTLSDLREQGLLSPTEVIFDSAASQSLHRECKRYHHKRYSCDYWGCAKGRYRNPHR